MMCVQTPGSRSARMDAPASVHNKRYLPAGHVAVPLISRSRLVLRRIGRSIAIAHAIHARTHTTPTIVIYSLILSIYMRTT